MKLIPAFLLSFSLLLGVASLDAASPAITHGPMLGRVTDATIRVWARTSQPGEFEFRYGTDTARLTQRSVKINTTLDHDLTAWAELTGLKPRTTYHVQAFIEGQPSGAVATFHTLPSADSVRNPEHNPKGLFNFRFEFGSCANQNPEHGIGPSLPAYTTMNRELAGKVDFAIMNGDWLYEELRDYPAVLWAERHGVPGWKSPAVVRNAPTIVGVWENYKLYLDRAANLTEWHRRVPSLFTFDDHELVNDLRGAATIGLRERRAVFRDIGVQAWFDYLGWANPTETRQPVHFGRAQLKASSEILYDPDADFSGIEWKDTATLHIHWGTTNAGVNDMKFDTEKGDPNAGVYEVREVIDKNRLRIRPLPVADGAPNYSIGRHSYGKLRVANCEFFLLDCKTHREMHDPKNPSKRGLTLLGTAQRDWLLKSMAASDADFFLVVSTVPFMIPHDGAGGFEMAAGKDEAWTALLDEREKLIKAWDRLQKPVFVLTGDLHNSFAIKITDRVWEFCSGPHNSVNHVPALDEGKRPATGLYKSGPRTCDIRWSSYILPDLARPQRMYPHYATVQVNNVFNMPKELGGERWVAYPHPQVIFQYFDGRTGELRYAEAITVGRK
jgi:alkaline phosphatase D